MGQGSLERGGAAGYRAALRVGGALRALQKSFMFCLQSPPSPRNSPPANCLPFARVAELVDALDSGSSGSNPVGVRVPPRAPTVSFCFRLWRSEARRRFFRPGPRGGMRTPAAAKRRPPGVRMPEAGPKRSEPGGDSLRRGAPQTCMDGAPAESIPPRAPTVSFCVRLWRSEARSLTSGHRIPGRRKWVAELKNDESGSHPTCRRPPPQSPGSCRRFFDTVRVGRSWRIAWSRDLGAFVGTQMAGLPCRVGGERGGFWCESPPASARARRRKRAHAPLDPPFGEGQGASGTDRGDAEVLLAGVREMMSVVPELSELVFFLNDRFFKRDPFSIYSTPP